MACTPSLSAVGCWARMALLVAGLGPLGAYAAADDGTALPQRVLADDARVAIAELIEEPVRRLPISCIAFRSEGAPMREYVVRQQALAIEALLASATTPAAAERVSLQLIQLRRQRYVSGATGSLGNPTSIDATAIRLLASLGELPAALEERMHPRMPLACCSAGGYLGLGRTGRRLGALAHSDYRRLTELEPADPWHWLVLAWLSGVEGEPSLQRSLAAAQARSTSEAMRARVFAWQQMAWLRRQQGRGNDAVAAATEAVRLAEAAVRQEVAEADNPAAELAQGDLAQTRNTLAIALDYTGQKAAALAVLQDVAPQQRRLADLRPHDLPAQYALIETLTQMGMLQIALDKSLETRGVLPPQIDEASTLYKKLDQQTRHIPKISDACYGEIVFGAFVRASLFTLVLGWALLWRYRRRVARLMRLATSHGDASTPPATAVTQPPMTVLAPVAIEGRLTPAARAAADALRRAAVVQVIAGLVFGLVAAWLQLRAWGVEADVIRMSLMVWASAWPTGLALSVVWDGDRRRERWAWAVYFGGLLLLSVAWAFGESPNMYLGDVHVLAFFQPLVSWALADLPELALLLLFLNRAVRSIGPALLAMFLVVMTGGTLAFVASAMPLAYETIAPLLQAAHVPADWMVLPKVLLVGSAAAAPVAWWVGRQLRTAYAAKWLSDQSLMIDALWLIHAAVLSLFLTVEIGPAGLTGLGAFVLHKAITLAGMRPAALAARQRRPARLLLLRVFGTRDDKGKILIRRARAERLFDLLASRWRYAGPIYMLGAPDLASSTLDPDEFLDFLSGRLRERFILEPADLPARLAAVDEGCDFDARWRVTELFCGNETWREAVLALMTRSDQVAMDLRDFGPDNRGCVFELQALIDLVPFQRLALLVDKSTDIDFLNATLDACLRRAAAGSPNAKEPGRVALVNIDDGEQAAVNQLLEHGLAGLS